MPHRRKSIPSDLPHSQSGRANAGLARSEANRRTNIARRIFKWAASEELVSPATFHALQTVAGLSKGRTTARETESVGPVDDAVVDATLPHLGRQVRGLIEFQRLTGCRPGEAGAVRRADLDTGGPIWLYRPPQHKNAHRGKARVVAIGPKAHLAGPPVGFLRPGGPAGTLGGVADLTRILEAAAAGDTRAAADLLPLVYDELRALAARQLADEKPGQTLQPTALVHEAYLRLAGDAGAGFANRRHFFAAAVQAMRRILVEAARAKGSRKRGGGRRREHPDLDALAAGGPAEDLLALHDALDEFAAHDPVKAQLVELRFFAGLTLQQAAECLDISPSTADRAWRYARAWLATAMAGDESEEK